MKTAIIVVVLLALGIGGFLLGTKLANPAGSSVATPTPAVPSSQTGDSLVALITSSQDLKCSFDNDGDKGTVYVLKGQARIELNATFDDGKYKDLYHMLDTGKLVYIWKNDDKGGFVVKPEALLTGSASVTSPLDNSPITTGGFNSDANYNYQCETANPDLSMFLVPSDVDFARAGLSNPTSNP